MFDKSAIETLQQAENIRLAALITPAGRLALPPDWQLHDVQHLQAAPARHKGKFITPSINSLGIYLGDKNAPIFVQADQGKATAILNAGIAGEPGHADDLAIWQPEKTAAHEAFSKITSGAMMQQTLAEFCEDWTANLSFYRDSETIPPKQAIAAIRAITIETAKKAESTVQQLSASRSTFESVAATSKEPPPTHIYFKCRPFANFQERTYACRLAILTGPLVPAMRLHVIQTEPHTEEIAQEFIAKINQHPKLKLCKVFEGSYSR
jgi:uncharacterized protein YfdQ (DUF2303 family)